MTGRTTNIKQVRPHAALREKIAKAEGVHMRLQDRAFGGDAVTAKYNELLRMYPGLRDLPEEEVDTLVSAYYNSTVNGFKHRFGKLILDHVTNRSLKTFDALYNAITTRWQDATKRNQEGIRSRNVWEGEMFNSSRGRYINENKDPILQDIYYKQWRQHLPQNLQKETQTYDLRGAYKAGVAPLLEDDGYYHLPSRNPDTGQYFKSAAHPSTLKAVIEDYIMGYQPQLINGKLGSIFSPTLQNVMNPSLLQQPQYPIINK